MPPGDERVNRRRFFRESLRELLKPLVNSVEPLQEAIRQFETISGAEGSAKRQAPAGAASSPGAPRLPETARRDFWLRPPGALTPDQTFRETCSRCRKCVEVCPAECIKIDPTGNNGHGAPYIEPDVMPCV